MKKTIKILVSILLFSNCVFLDAIDNEAPKIIYLIGEYHDDPDDVKFRTWVDQLASERKIIAAEEGLERDLIAETNWKEKLWRGKKGTGYLHGVEDFCAQRFLTAMLVNRISRMAIHYNDFEKEEVSLSEKLELLEAVTSIKFKKLFPNFWHSKSLQNNSIFNSLRINKAFSRKYDKWSTSDWREFAKWSSLDWIEFTRELALVFAEDMKNKLSSQRLEILQVALTYLNQTDDIDFENNFGRLVAINLRDDFIAKNLEEIYAFTHIGKPLVCILGQAHIKGVSETLRKQGFTVLDKEALRENMENKLVKDQL